MQRRPKVDDAIFFSFGPMIKFSVRLGSGPGSDCRIDRRYGNNEGFGRDFFASYHAELTVIAPLTSPQSSAKKMTAAAFDAASLKVGYFEACFDNFK